MFKASIKVTLGAYDLIDFTLYQDNEPRLSQSPSVDVVESLRGTHVRTFGRKNIRNQYVFSRVQNHGTRDLAVKFLHDFAELWPVLQGTATIITNGDSKGHSFADASIASVEGAVDAMLTRHTITLVGGSWTAVP